MFQNQVVIGPEFFAKSFNDYNNWKWAIAREFMQNSMDCGSTAIDVSIKEVDGNTELTVANNGSTMSRDILVNKLLSLGGSGKSFTNGAVGGFGKAKEILYYAHQGYQIHSGAIKVVGVGAGYNIEDVEYFSGTKSVITLKGDVVWDITRQFFVFANIAQWDGVLTINGEIAPTAMKKGKLRRDLGFAKVYTNKSFTNKVVVRIGGVPMFTEYCSLDRCVVVELDGISVDVLTSNRDGLTYAHSRELNAFITELAVDKRSALRNRDITRIRHYDGHKFRSIEANTGSSSDSGDSSVGAGTRQLVLSAKAAGCAVVEKWQHDNVDSASCLSEEFLVKNNTEYQVPAYYLPDSKEFSAYSVKLVKIWGRLLLQLHKLFKNSDAFAVGFIFDEMAEAEYDNTADGYGVTYFIGPAVIDKSGSFKKRFLLTERNRLLMIALHEYLHQQYRYHDEDYASALTDMAAKVMDSRKDFNWCFAS